MGPALDIGQIEMSFAPVVEHHSDSLVIDTVADRFVIDRKNFVRPAKIDQIACPVLVYCRVRSLRNGQKGCLQGIAIDAPYVALCGYPHPVPDFLHSQNGFIAVRVGEVYGLMCPVVIVENDYTAFECAPDSPAVIHAYVGRVAACQFEYIVFH